MKIYERNRTILRVLTEKLSEYNSKPLWPCFQRYNNLWNIFKKKFNLVLKIFILFKRFNNSIFKKHNLFKMLVLFNLPMNVNQLRMINDKFIVYNIILFNIIKLSRTKILNRLCFKIAKIKYLIKINIFETK